MDHTEIYANECPSQDELRDYMSGSGGERTSAIKSHLERCPLCAARLNDFTRPDGPLGTSVGGGNQQNSAHHRNVSGWDVSTVDLQTPGSESTLRTNGELLANRYQIETYIAQGGMGVVHRAMDVVFGREVAVKRLLSKNYHDIEASHRFRKEAILTAQLQHPGIPPIHDLGTLPDGAPFLAMKLIAGNTLATLLRQRANPRDDFQHFLSVFEQIASAVGFAHAQGVIHRDLKPANVMVGAFGEVQVMDWGLAKKIGPKEAADLPTDKNKSADAAPEEHQQTMDGAVMGTPRYMAPEQARGNISELEASADVFSLGAILIDILGGSGVYEGQSPGEILINAMAGLVNVPHDELRLIGIDAKLTAIAAKCLQVNASQRPKNGSEVATMISDYRSKVDRLLRESESKRAADEATARGNAKRRFVIGIGAGVIVSILVLSTGLLSFLWRKAENNLNNADHRFEQARKAVDDYLLKVHTNPYLQIDELQPFRNELLQNALAYYQAFLTEKGDEPSLPRSLAAARLRSAWIHREMKERARAQKDYEVAFSQYDQLIDARQDQLELRVERAKGQIEYGIFQLEDPNGVGAAKDTLQKASDELVSLQTKHPKLQLNTSIVECHTALYEAYRRISASDAMFHAVRAVELMRELLKTAPNSPAFKRGLAKSLNDLGVLNSETRQLTQARSAFVESASLWKELVVPGRLGIEAGAAEARIQHELALIERQLGDVKQSTALLEQALLNREKVAYLHGRDHLESLAQSSNDLGTVLALNVDMAIRQRGNALLHEALAMRQKIFTATGTPKELLALAQSNNNMASVTIEQGKPAEATSYLENNRKLYAQLTSDRADEKSSTFHRGLTAHLEGYRNMSLGQFDAARDALNEAKSIREGAVESDAHNPELLTALIGTYVMLGNVDIVSQSGDPVASFEKAVQTSEELTAMSPESADALFLRSVTRYSLANALSRANPDPAKAIQLIQDAIEDTKTLLIAAPTFSNAKALQTQQRMRLAEILIPLEPAKAVGTLVEGGDLSGINPAFNVPYVNLLAVALGNLKEELTEDKRKAAVETIEAGLTRALAAGADKAELEKIPALAPYLGEAK